MTGAAQDRLEAAVPSAVERIRAVPGVVGALWCGGAARGEGNEYSDLDVHVLVAGDHRWRSAFTVDGVPVEAFFTPARKVRAMFASGEGDTITMDAQGRTVLAHPDLDALVAQARALHAAGPTPRPPTPMERHRLLDAIVDARALAAVGDPLHVLVACRAASIAAELLFRRWGWWETKAQGWLGVLDEREPDTAVEFRTVLTASDPGVRQAALEALAIRVTGDLAYRDARSEPQPVP